MTALKLHLTG